MKILVDGIDGTTAARTASDVSQRASNTAQQVSQQVVQSRTAIEAYHATQANYVESLAGGVRWDKLSPFSRFGRALYVAQDAGTALVEAKGADTVVRYQLTINPGKMLDLTNPEVAAKWGYVRSTTPEALAQHQRIAELAANEFEVIKYESLRIAGAINYAVLKNYNEIAQMVRG